MQIIHLYKYISHASSLCLVSAMRLHDLQPYKRADQTKAWSRRILSLTKSLRSTKIYRIRKKASLAIQILFKNSILHRVPDVTRAPSWRTWLCYCACLRWQVWVISAFETILAFVFLVLTLKPNHSLESPAASKKLWRSASNEARNVLSAYWILLILISLARTPKRSSRFRKIVSD